jgi:hypothetical protein
LKDPLPSAVFTTTVAVPLTTLGASGLLSETKPVVDSKPKTVRERFVVKAMELTDL